MKPPVEEVRVSVRGRETLIKLKRRTGLTQWNHLCRLAYCRSLSNPTPPGVTAQGEAGIRMDWKTFAGSYSREMASLLALRALRDNINLMQKEEMAEYFRAHLERGIASLDGVADVVELVNSKPDARS